MSEYFVYGYTFSGEKQLISAFTYPELALSDAEAHAQNMGWTTTFVVGPNGFYKTFVNTALKK